MQQGYLWLRRALFGARWILGPLALVFLVVAGFSARDTLERVVRNAEWSGLATAVILWSALHLLSPVFTWVVLRGFGTPVRYKDALAIHVSRLPARYLPGGIWHTVSRVADLHDRGISRTHLAGMVALENAIPVAVALILGGTFLFAGGNDWRASTVCVLVGSALLACLPIILRHRLVAKCRLDFRDYFLAIGVTVAFWLAASAAFAQYWLAFPGQAESSLPNVVAAYLLGWAAGFVAVFAPQGLGVFESVAGALLRGELPFAGAAMLVAGFRAAILVADVIAYAVFSIHRYAARRTHVDTISGRRL